MALWVKRKFGLRFLLTEHWGLYNAVVEDNITTKPFFFRLMLKRIFREAAGFVSVSRYLGEGVNRFVLRKEFAVVSNVVDTNLFFPASEKEARFTFLHVSNMVPLKNVAGILHAFELFLTQSGVDAQLVLIGNRDQAFLSKAQEMGLLHKNVFFRGEIRYAEVAQEMQKAHVLVLNSIMENSPCVIGEALCCGLPVVATNVGGIPELLAPENSLLVPPRNDTALATAFLTIYRQYNTFNCHEIADRAKARFSMPVIGQQHHRLYS
jgi:glycosyltransferase involved in cell wall biosynthesis